MRSAFLVWI